MLAPDSTDHSDRPGETGPRLRPPDELTHLDFEMVVRRLADDLAFGSDASLFVGSGLEYAQSRPYEPGDPVKQIDWRISARLGRAYIKQYETLKRIAMYLVIDTSSSMSAASTRLTKHDMAIWIASAIGLVGLRRMSPVGVVGGGERETRLELSLARGDLWRAIEPLRMHATGETTSVGERLRTLEPRMNRSSLVIVISDLHDPEAVSARQLPVDRPAHREPDLLVAPTHTAAAEHTARGRSLFDPRDAPAGARDGASSRRRRANWRGRGSGTCT